MSEAIDLDAIAQRIAAYRNLDSVLRAEPALVNVLDIAERLLERVRELERENARLEQRLQRTEQEIPVVLEFEGERHELK